MRSKPITPYEHLRREHQRLLDTMRERRHVSLFRYNADSVSNNSVLQYIVQQSSTANLLGYDMVVKAYADGSVIFECVERMRT